MFISKGSQPGTAFTLLELLVVIAIVGILATLLLPSLQRARVRAKSLACLSQLRQIGIASIAFASDHNDRLPAATMPNTNRTLSPFQAVLQEIGTSRLFLCPADSERHAGSSLGVLDRSNTSYFISYSARTDQPRSIVAGDRNITLVSQTGVSALPVVFVRQTGAMTFYRTNTFGWWRDLHQSRGNLLLADGSVHTTSASELNAQIAAQPDPSFSWYLPNGDVISTPP